MRLSPAGPAALGALAATGDAGPGRGSGGGWSRPGSPIRSPTRAPADATVVIPVRDRPSRAPDWPRVIVVDDGSRVPVSRRVAARRRRAARAPRATPRSRTWTPSSWRSWTPTASRRPTGSSASPATSPTRASPPSPRACRGCSTWARIPPRSAPAGACLRPVGRADRPPRAHSARSIQTLRFGEDVDLIWRLVDAGWRVRYDPRVVVAHDDGRRLVKRFHYGTSAAPLSLRHPGRLAPLSAPAAGPRCWRRAAAPRAAASPPASPSSSASRPPSTPGSRRAGHRAVRPPPPGMPATLGDVAYGLGVYAGCMKHRTVQPLLPRLNRRKSNYLNRASRP